MSRLSKVMDQEDRIRNGDDISFSDNLEKKAKQGLKNLSDPQYRKKMKKREEKGKKKKKEKKQKKSSYGRKEYSSGNKPKKSKKPVFFLVVVLVLSVIYAPQFFMKDNDETSAKVKLDTSAVSTARTVLKRLPSADFDGDGINNSDEEKYGSNPYFVDSDNDGINDYCEVYVTKTNPAKADEDYLITKQKKIDSSAKKDLGSPYKIGNDILWPDDYTSRSYGSVIETINGYRFKDFNGYAQFPDASKHYYQYTDGIRKKLEYRKEEKVYKIKSDKNGECTVEMYSKPLKFKEEFSAFNHHFYFPQNLPLQILTDVLPDKGFITGIEKTTVDIDPDTSDAVTADINIPDYDKTSDARFTLNTNTLNDLQYLRETIKSGSCVALSLYKEDEGEYIGIAYGYTSTGDIMIADPDTKDYIGNIQIREKAKKMMNKDGDIVSFSYFDYSGLGFDSEKGDRICMFASTASGQLVKSPADTDVSDSSEDNGTQQNSSDSTDSTDSTDSPDGTDSADNTDSTDSTNTDATDSSASNQNTDDTAS